MEQEALKLYNNKSISQLQFMKLHSDITQRNEIADHKLLKHVVEEFACKSCAKKYIAGLINTNDLIDAEEALYILINYYWNKGYSLMRIIDNGFGGIKYVFEENIFESRLFHPNGAYIHIYYDISKIGYVKYDLT